MLLIAVDDLRPDLGAYGHPLVSSPNIDALASKSVVFKHHYVTVPTCGASRASLLTGMLPRNRAFLNNQVFGNVISKQPESTKPESFVQHLRSHNYYTVGIGKISHSADGRIYEYDQPVGTELELPNSWDEMLMDYGQWETGWNAFFAYAGGDSRTTLNKMVKPYESAMVEDEGYPDGLMANLAVKKLEELASTQQPFFLGVGFFKPHLPFNAPKKYWDLYDREEITLAPNQDIPQNINLASLHGSGEFNQYELGEEKASLDSVLSDGYSKKLVHGYMASISYVDAQIGKVLNSLEALGLQENTMIILWSDHGWHLGDQRVWGKHTVFEKALRSPLIIKPPKTSEGQLVEQVVSTVDIYPTIIELCGLTPITELHGSSLAPLMDNPGTNWDNQAFSYYRNGISLRTPDYRITKYFRLEQPNIELYDYQSDPNEQINIADQEPELVEKLLELLNLGDTGLYEDSAN